jgi:hypothetical protein
VRGGVEREGAVVSQPKSVYGKAVEWHLSAMTKDELAMLDRIENDNRVGVDDYSQALVLGFVSGYKAAQADAAREGKVAK